MDKLRKKVIATFKDEKLSITTDTNLDEKDFLDVTFNLKTGKYFPFRKPNNNRLYINCKSNHPPPIIKELPKMVNKKFKVFLAMRKNLVRQNLSTKMH